MKKIFLIPLLIFFFVGCKSDKKDYRSVLSALDVKKRNCLDGGSGMIDCTYRYEVEMDSLLNVVYKDLMSVYSKEQQDQLRKEERAWIKKLEIENKKIYAGINRLRDKGEWVPQDDRMIAYNQQAEFIRERVLVLIEKYEKK